MVRVVLFYASIVFRVFRVCGISGVKEFWCA